LLGAAHVADRTEQPQPNHLVRVRHRDQRGEVRVGGSSGERSEDLGAVGRGSLEDAAQLGERGGAERRQVGADVGVLVKGLSMAESLGWPRDPQHGAEAATRCFPTQARLGGRRSRISLRHSMCLPDQVR
jgi:hypothetical protein